MRVFILSILVFSSVQLYSQGSDFDEVDRYVDSLQLSASISPESLVTRLTKAFNSPTLKTRAIYYWIARNIRYDHEGLRNGYWKKYSSERSVLMDTYKLRKGICSGYSNLFKYMLNKAKIESEVIDGYLRCDLQTVMIDSMNHAWNAVRLNNKWYLFDVTGAASNALKNRVNNFWFKTPPELFVLTHYPEDIKWTLLDEDISLTDFKSYPVYTLSFIEMSISKGFSRKGYYKAVDNVISLELKANKDYVWLPKLYDLDKGEWLSPESVEVTGYENGYLRLTINRKGKFILQLDAAENRELGFTIYQELVYYVVDNS